MGTDIHIICQVKKDNIWINNPIKIFKNSSYRFYSDKLPKDRPEWAREKYTTDPPNDRHYDWFAVLANVRNGTGFAGIITGDGFNYIDEPRGFPPMFYIDSDYITPEGIWLGYHSHSYINLEELETFDWNQVTTKRGSIPIDCYKSLRNTGNSPSAYAGACTGPGIVTVNERTADDILDGIKSIEAREIYVDYTWPVIYKDIFDYEITNIIKPMIRLRDEYQFEDVRIVFGFDS